MIEKQVKQIVKKIAVNDYIMENMFCAPKGALGRFGGKLMSQDRWLPAWVLDLLAINPLDSILEVGSGPGVGLEEAAERVYEGRVVGLDPSETMLEMAHRRNRTLIEAKRVELHLGSADKLPFDDAMFDKAMTMISLHLWANPVAGLREIKRTLRPGGRIRFDAPARTFALRREPDRSADVRRHRAVVAICRCAGVLGSGAARDESRSDGSAAM